MKKDGRRISKRGLVGLRRVVKAGEKDAKGNPKRIWVYKGQEFNTLREVRRTYPFG